MVLTLTKKTFIIGELSSLAKVTLLHMIVHLEILALAQILATLANSALCFSFI